MTAAPSPTFWDDMADTMFPPERIAAASGEVEALVTLLGIDRPLDILDMPCGVGRHAIQWAIRGHRVTGVDLTAAYLERARVAAGAAGLPPEGAPGGVRWVQHDMERFAEHGAFDLVTNLWTSFGYGATRAADRAVAEAFHAALRPGGRLVMDLAGKEVVAGRFQPRRWHPREDDVVVLERARVVDGWDGVEMCWTAITPARAPAPPSMTQRLMRLRLYSARELVDLLEGVGFGGCRVYGSAAGAPYDHEASRLVVVASRP